MNRHVAIPACVLLWVGCLELRGPQADPGSDPIDVEAQALLGAHPACDGKPRGADCPSASYIESNQCDGQGRCVDCVNHIGCNESSVCDAAIQTCVNFVQPASPQCTGAPRGAPCELAGGGSDPDYCDGLGRCIDCLSDTGCSTDHYCDLFGEICLHRTAPPPAPPPPPPSSTLKIRCSVAPGGSARDDACEAPLPQSVTSITFEVPPNSFETSDTIYQWGVQTPDGEPFARKSGCFNDRHCTIDVRPKTGGAPRVYRASLYMTEEFHLERGLRLSATATVGPAPGPALALGPAELDIDPIGGAITLPDLASVSFPNGVFFGGTTRVRLEATSRPETDRAWRTSAEVFGATNRTPQEVRISAAAAPDTPIFVTVAVPPGYVVEPNTTLTAFAQILTSSNLDSHDLFDALDSEFSEQNRTVKVTLPPDAFTDLRTASPDQFEAVLLLASLPIVPGPTPTMATATPLNNVMSPAPSNLVVGEPMANTWPMAAASAETCSAPELGRPLPTDLRVNSPYNIDPPAGGKAHKGTDLNAAIGTPVLAMADGVIESIKDNLEPLAKPNPRTGIKAVGFGRYIVLAHDAKPARTVYAHLKLDGVQVVVGQRVRRGEVIALSGNTGASTGPHLHVEYIPNGPFSKSAKRLDPDQCINPDLPPSTTNPGPPAPTPNPAPGPNARTILIGIADSGNLLDDAFQLTLNGQICSTLPGQSKICSFSGVNPGVIRPELVCTIAPDGVCTIAIQLGPGLLFTATGTTFVNGSFSPGLAGRLFPVITVR